MITYNIHAWGCRCGYVQDFEPTQENIDKHFNHDPAFRLGDVREHECPSCALRGHRPKMQKLAAGRMTHSHIEASDLDRMESELTGDDALPDSDRRKEIAEARSKLKSPEEIAQLRSLYEDTGR